MEIMYIPYEAFTNITILRRPMEALLRRLAYPHAVDDLGPTAELLRVVFLGGACWYYGGDHRKHGGYEG